MNYDMWQDLWERQPVPAPPLPSKAELLLREIRMDREKEDEGVRQFVRSAFVSALVLAALGIYPLLHHGFDLMDWCAVLLWGSYAGTGWVFRRRRIALDRGYGESLLDRVDHARAVLVESHRYVTWNMIVPILVTMLVVALFAAEVSETQSLLIPLLAGGSVLLLPLLLTPFERKRRDKLRQRLALLQEIRTQVASGAEAK